MEFGRVRSLAGHTVVFTGPVGIRRADARRLAEQAGARVLAEPSGAMDVLVVGDDSPLWIAGSSGGIKVLEALALRERGVLVTFINAKQFMRLVERA
jgi:BRCT domain type II-containing protein